MNKPHKHAELIKAWADGAVIEALDCGHWYECVTPDWEGGYKFRIKPEPKPDVVGNVYANSLGTLEWIMGQMKPKVPSEFA